MTAGCTTLVIASTGDWQILNPVILWCVLAAVVYTYGRRELRRTFPRSPLLSPLRELSFWAAIAVVVVALISPLDVWAEQLFTFHMIQHLILAVVAPLLFVLARTLSVASFGLRPATRRLVLQTGHHISTKTGLSPNSTGVALGAAAAHVIVFAGWHVPALYDAAVRNDWLHIMEHLSMFLTGLLFWSVVIGVGWQSRSALSLAYLFLVGLPMGSLAALLTLAPAPLFASHLLTAADWGLTPLQDQQLAGGVMWVPGSMLYLGLGVFLFVRWLGSGPAPGATPVGSRS